MICIELENSILIDKDLAKEILLKEYQKVFSIIETEVEKIVTFNTGA